MLPLKSFYVMRHGQTTDNALCVISGAGSDPHLTEMGREQARAAAQIFKNLPAAPTRIVTSALRRTHQTAELVAGHLEYFAEPDLNERHLGEHDGKITEAEQKMRKNLPGEESTDDHARRVIKAVSRHLAHEDMTLFVCHGGTVRRILEALNLQNAVHVGNAEIYFIEASPAGWAVSMPGVRSGE